MNDTTFAMDNFVHDAQPGDVYADKDGKLWRVWMTCGEPTVHMEEIEPEDRSNPCKKGGGISGLMWLGFRRIFRPDPPAPPPLPPLDIRLCEKNDRARTGHMGKT